MSPIELEQVFVNLILNAIQAQSEGAQVWVSARQSGHEIEIRVDDLRTLTVAKKPGIEEMFARLRVALPVAEED